MVIDVFSSFDPSCVFGVPLNWSAAVFSVLFVPPRYWGSPSRLTVAISKIHLALYREFGLMTGSGNKNGALLFTGLFLYILVNNFLGLFPHVFTSTTHMVATMTLALPLWFAFMLFGWINRCSHMFAHLVPEGSPGFLSPFMVLIETASLLIRPATLAIRLTANVMAGHILLTLLGSVGPTLSMGLGVGLVLTQVLLLVLELAVAIIQSYVFTALAALYASEV